MSIDVIGKFAYKNKGFYSGIIGVIQLNDVGITKYMLVHKDGSKNGFNHIDEVIIIENLKYIKEV